MPPKIKECETCGIRRNIEEAPDCPICYADKLEVELAAMRAERARQESKANCLKER